MGASECGKRSSSKGNRDLQYTPSQIQEINNIPNPFHQKAVRSQSAESNASSVRGLRYTQSEVDTIRGIPDFFAATPPSASSSCHSFQSVPTCGVRYTSSEVDLICGLPDVFAATPPSTSSSCHSFQSVPTCGVRYTSSEVDLICGLPDVFAATPPSASSSCHSFQSVPTCGVRYTSSEVDTIRGIPDFFAATPPSASSSCHSFQSVPTCGLRYTSSEVDAIRQIPNVFASSYCPQQQSTKKSFVVSTAKSPSSSSCKGDIKSDGGGGSEREVRSPQGSAALLNRDLRSPSEIMELRGYPSFVDGLRSKNAGLSGPRFEKFWSEFLKVWTFFSLGSGGANRQIPIGFRPAAPSPSSSANSVAPIRGLSYTPSEVDSIRKLPNPFLQKAARSQSAESNASSLRGLQYTQSEVNFIRGLPDVFAATPQSPSSSCHSFQSVPTCGLRYTSSEVDAIRQIPNVFASSYCPQQQSTKKSFVVSTAKSPSSSSCKGDIKSDGGGGSEREVRSPQGSATLLNRDLRSPSEIMELRGYPSFVDGLRSKNAGLSGPRFEKFWSEFLKVWTFFSLGSGGANRQIPIGFRPAAPAPSSSANSVAPIRGLSYTPSEVDSIRKLPNPFLQKAARSQSAESNASSLRGLQYTQSEVDLIRGLPDVFAATPQSPSSSCHSFHPNCGPRYAPSEVDAIRRIPDFFNATSRPSSSKEAQQQSQKSSRKLLRGAK